MKIFKNYYNKGIWTDDFSKKINEESVVLVFGNDTTGLAKLKELYPSAKIVGCSTAGQIYGKELKEEGLVRTPIQFCPEERTITYTGEIPQGKHLRMMRANISDMIDAAENIIKNTWEKVDKDHRRDDCPSDIMNLLVSCAGRKAVLGTETEDEFFMADKYTTEKTTQVGFYSYGEFNRVNEDKGAEFLNQTMTIVSIYER